LMGFSGRLSLRTALSTQQKFRQIIWDYCRSQWLMLVGLLVPLIIFISSFSLASPVANALAIPVITFMVVPCLLLAAVLDSLFPGWGQGLLSLAAFLLEWLLDFLRALLNIFPFEANPLIDLTLAMMLFLAFCCLLLLLPKGFFPRVLSSSFLVIGLLLTMILPIPDQPDLKLLVMDVGQGTAIVVQVKNKTLVYDTGAKFSDNFDAGSGILVPYLRSRSIRQLDMLVVSHNDQDHAGGLEGLLANIAVKQLLLGQYQPIFQPTQAQRILYRQANQLASCHDFPAWQWQQVKFRFISWPLRYRASANNYSCLLEITYLDQIILLPGDLEREVESQLLRNQQLPQSISLLLAGHHGSQTSSSPEFVKRLRPRQVVYSAGYDNRYGHPHKSVRNRFQSLGSTEFNTAEQGALEFSWKNGVNQPVLTYRDLKRRYWY
jgi:competence protein ComEC